MHESSRNRGKKKGEGKTQDVHSKFNYIVALLFICVHVCLCGPWNVVFMCMLTFEIPLIFFFLCKSSTEKKVKKSQKAK